MKRAVLGAMLVILGAASARAQSQTVGLFVHDEQAYDGYTLMGPLQSKSVYLLTNDGLVVHEWATGKIPSHTTLYFQHDALWIPPGLPGAGNITIFNNGTNRPGGNKSSVDEMVPAVDENGDYPIAPGVPFGPAAPSWSYLAGPEFYSPFIGGSVRLPGGTTLVGEGWSGHLFEVTPSSEVVWDYVNPVYTNGILAQGQTVPTTNQVFKVRRYPADYPGLAGRDLEPGDPLELFQAPRPVPSGSLTAGPLPLGGDGILVAWDATSCPSAAISVRAAASPGPTSRPGRCSSWSPARTRAGSTRAAGARPAPAPSATPSRPRSSARRRPRSCRRGAPEAPAPIGDLHARL